jgi:anthranilate phosphoribosyltransferase
VRTIFNLLGPLTNPAGAQNQVLGVFSGEIIELMAAALAELGVERAFVVRGAGGIGEFSLAGETLVAEVKKGTIQHYAVTPEDFGVSSAPLDSLVSGTAAENAARIRRVFGGEPGPAHDIVMVNAAAALVATGAAKNFREGANLAAKAISSGAAEKKLAALVEFTRQS